MDRSANVRLPVLRCVRREPPVDLRASRPRVPSRSVSAARSASIRCLSPVSLTRFLAIRSFARRCPRHIQRNLIDTHQRETQLLLVSGLCSCGDHDSARTSAFSWPCKTTSSFKKHSITSEAPARTSAFIANGEMTCENSKKSRPSRSRDFQSRA
ncbi:hypothetical protein B0H14DRAFT_2997521 [Mycena olivaceomarginata]|nr:hypothetical protein B0H14DRAFT_2997521 [Mycena olivaceomarginata]